MAHAIQLAVVDVLYKKETTEERTFCSNESIDFDSYSDAEEHEKYGTYEEGLVMDYIKLEFRKEYFLIADSKTRWNSLLAKLERFYKLKSCIQKSDIDLKLNINFTETDFETVSATI